MSFMNSGSECSTSRNPIAQFTKHTLEDRSLQHERFNSPATASGSMRSANQPMNSADRQMMNNFMNGEAQTKSNAFAFDKMRQELPPVANRHQGWANDFSLQPQAQASPLTAVTGGESVVRHSPATADARWGAEFQSSTSSASFQQPQQPNFYGSSGFMPQMSQMYAPSMLNSGAMVNQTAASSSRVVELDNQHWEEQFRQIEESAQNQQETAADKGKSISDNQQEADPEITDKTDFEAVWNNIRSQIFDNDEHDWVGQERMPAWDRDFDQFTKSRPDFGQYEFEQNNHFLQETDPFAIGVQIVESGGNLSEAALAFEAAVQKDDKHAEAWSRLGSVQAQNEKESSAIRALERCIDLEPDNLTALLNLAVSYTNESYENAAYSTLERWIATKYPEVVNQARTDFNMGSKTELHARVTELFIKAAQLSPDGVNIDSSVQDGLGVLFYGNDDFDKAIDCFKTALSVRPNDPLLWNRLGATLANSSRSEEAIEAYSRALQLRPTFVRARYNLGVSCVNIGCYHEAAQHLLTALSLNDVEGASKVDVLANQSTNLLSSLKRVFLAMNRRDLADKVGNGMDLSSFRSEFDF